MKVKTRIKVKMSPKMKTRMKWQIVVFHFLPRGLEGQSSLAFILKCHRALDL